MSEITSIDIEEFLDKLEKLEDEYGIFVGVDVDDHWDYDIDDNPYLAYSEAFVSLEDADGMLLKRLDY